MSDDRGGSDRDEHDGREDDEPDAGEPSVESRNDGGLPRLDRYFDALSDQRRRYALYHLERRGSASEEELARNVVARETGRSADDLSPGEYEHVQSELHHNHLPRLADYGIVEFDPRSKTARFGEQTTTFAMLLQLSRFVEGGREERTS